MAEASRRRLALDPVGRDDIIGTWLAAMDEARQRTLRLLDDLAAAALDWSGDGAQSVATNLYHLAAVEADWLHLDVLELPEFPAEVTAWFPQDVRDEDQRLTPITGRSLDDLVNRLHFVRELLFEAFAAMPLEDFRRLRAMPRADATPEWILHHLLQHEAEHRASIGDALARCRAATPGTPA